MPNRNILLIEPGYKNKYPPLGLMKLAAYHGPYGKKDNVVFIKGDGDPRAKSAMWDRVYVTTLFSFEWKEIAKSIDHAIGLAGGNPKKVFVGGIAASLMHEKFLVETRWRGVRFIKGLLTEAPAVSLQLDEFEEELYADDVNGTPIEDSYPTTLFSTRSRTPISTRCTTRTSHMPLAAVSVSVTSAASRS
jgi:hypothetical protein